MPSDGGSGNGGDGSGDGGKGAGNQGFGGGGFGSGDGPGGDSGGFGNDGGYSTGAGTSTGFGTSDSGYGSYAANSLSVTNAIGDASARAIGARAARGEGNNARVNPFAVREKSFLEKASDVLGVIGNVANLALNPNPISKATSAVALGKMASDSGFSLGSIAGKSGAPAGASSSGGLGGLGNGGKPDVNFGISGGAVVGGSFERPGGGLVFSSQDQTGKTPLVSDGGGTLGGVSPESGGAVAYTPTESNLTVSKPFDIMGLLLPIAALFLFKE